MKFEITELSRRSEKGLFGTTIEGWSASVELASGEQLSLSQLEGEAPQWGVDALFGANGFPHWSNGFGSRVVSVRAVAGHIAEALNTRRDEIAAAEVTAEK